MIVYCEHDALLAQDGVTLSAAAYEVEPGALHTYTCVREGVVSDEREYEVEFVPEPGLLPGLLAGVALFSRLR